MANSPLRPPTLASVKTWGIQQELVICRYKGRTFSQFKKMKNIIFVILGLIFLLFAYFQINDLDPVRWVPIYLLPAFLSFWRLKNRGNSGFFYGLAIGYFITAMLQWPPEFEGFLFEELKMRSLNIELARESGGLAITALAMAYLGFSK